MCRNPLAFKSAIRVEFDLPERSSCRIRDKKIAIRVEGKSIGDEILWVSGQLRSPELEEAEWLN